MAADDYVGRQRSVGDGVHQDAVPEIAGSDHPQVVDDTGDEAHIPERAVFQGEEHRNKPEGIRRVGAEGNAREIVGIDHPAHEPASPEKFFKDRHGYYANGDPEQEKNRIALRGWRRVARRMPDQAVVEQDEMMPVRDEYIRSHPYDENGEAQQNTQEGFRRATA